MNTISKYRSVQILVGSIATSVVLFPIATLVSTPAQAITIDLGAATNFNSLSNSISIANSNTSNTYNIGINSEINLTAMLPMITNANINFVGNGTSTAIINGQNQFEGFFINSGNISFSNITIKNGFVQGGPGLEGGGGLGAGGALFIRSGTVTTNTVNFVGNQAVGGRGCCRIDGATVAGGNLNNNPSFGIGNGGFGGGSTIGSDGGFGGGGAGGGRFGVADGIGGGGGFGAGGGTSNTVVPLGGFAGGGGGRGDDITPRGGAGAGLGGAIFIREGSLILSSSDTFSGNSATGGKGFAGEGSGLGGAIFIDNSTIDSGITSPRVISFNALPQFSGNTAIPSFNGITGTDNVFGTIQVTSVPPTAVPEPLTIIGTIIGGTAAMRMRKKLKSTGEG
jgi:hypothetical protein